MKFHRSLLALLLFGPTLLFAFAELNVLDLNTSAEGTAEIEFLTPTCQVIRFQAGSGLQIEGQSGAPDLSFTGWSERESALAATIEGSRFIEFECRLAPGVRQVLGIDLYASRSGSEVPTRLAIAAKAGVFDQPPALEDVRGSVALRREGEAPIIDSGKSFRSLPIDADAPLFTFRIYADGPRATDDVLSSAAATVTIDAIVVYTTTDAPTEPIKSESPVFKTSPLDSIVLVSPRPRAPARATTVRAAPGGAVALVAGKENPESEERVEIQLRPEASRGTPITLELGREIIGEELTPTGLIEGDAELLSAGVGDGCEIVIVSARWFKQQHQNELLTKVVAYRGWASDPEGQRMDLAGALKHDVYCEYTVKFGPSVSVINAVVPFANRRSRESPWRLNLFSFSGAEAPGFSPTDFNGRALVYEPSQSISETPVPHFKPIELEANRTVTFRFYFSGHPAVSQFNNAPFNLDKVVFLTE